MKLLFVVVAFSVFFRNEAKLNMKQALTMNQILSIYSLTETRNEMCRNDSTEMNRGLRAFEPWALQMFDSSSKLQSGILAGNLIEFGAFQQCLGVYKNVNGREIRGKHCSIKIYPDLELLRRILQFRNITRKRFTKVYTFVKKAALIWAICIPDSCTSFEIIPHFKKIIYPLTEGLNLTVTLNERDCYTVSDIKALEKHEIVVIAFFAAFLGIVFICTTVDLFVRNDGNGESTLDKRKALYLIFLANKIVNIFSAYSNAKQIFSKGSKSDLDCVHGIRFLSTCYVVIGHRYLMMMFFPVINSLQIMDWVVYYRSTAITGGTLCVDTFFMVSGMLVSVGYFREISKKNSINWVLFYFYRFMRITLPLAIVVLIYATLVHHLGSGPLWNDMLDIVQKPCQEYWWATILHVQNYVHPFPLCITQAWYLTCDMQYFLLSPIILVPLAKHKGWGLANFIIIYILAVASSFYFAWINNYSGGVPVTNQLFSTKYFQQHYITPHTRAATYIIGLGFGYALCKNNEKPHLSYPLVVLGWLLASATMLASLIGCHNFHMAEHDYNRWESTIYISFSRSAWTFGLVWIIWACINGYGGVVNAVLSSYLFRILSRISYSIYLLHMQMQYLISGAAKMPLYFSDFSALYAAFSDLFIMVLIGFAFTICFESPLIKALATILKGRPRKINDGNQ